MNCMNPSPSAIRLILGIGNPGPEFRNTYHNVGLLALEVCAAGDRAGEFRNPSRKHFSHARGKRFLFAHSRTFMNESGISAREACSFFKVPPGSLAVLHDESDLPLGTFQCAFGKNPAGHKGVASIAEALGTTSFWRIRIGIRPEKESVRRKAGEFVLSPILPEDGLRLAAVFEEISGMLQSLPVSEA